MNIFIVDCNPNEAAKQLPDKHINKMPLETAQMISVIYSPWYYNWGTIPKKDGTPYSTTKGAFRNHPCTQWAAKEMCNLAWLIKHGFALCDEFSERFGKTHSCEKTLCVATEIFKERTKEDLNIWENVKGFVRAMPDELKYDDTIDTIEAYKKYVASKSWVRDNYLRIPERKPMWIEYYA